MAEGVDASVYSGLGQNSPQWLGMLGQAAAAQNQLNQNRMFQQEFQARQALGPIFQQSVGPDGRTDWAKVLTLGAMNPKTAWKMPELATQVAQRQLLDQQTVGAALDVAQKRVQMLGAGAASLLQYGPKVTGQQYAGKVAELWQEGALGDPNLPDSKAFAMNALSNMPADGQPLYQHLMEISQQATGADKALGLTLGAIQNTPAGGGTVMGSQSVLTGYHQAGFIPNTPTTEQTNALTEVTVTRDNYKALGLPPSDIGQKVDISRGAAAPMYSGQPSQFVPSVMGGTPEGNALMAQAPQGQGNPLTGQGPTPVAPALGPTQGLQPPPSGGAGGQQGQGAPGPSASAPNAGPQPLATGQAATSLPPFQQGTIDEAVKYKADLDTTVSKLQNTLMTMRPLETALSHISTGGLAEIRANAGQWLQGLGIPQKTIDAIANGSLSDSQVVQQLATKQIFSNLRDLINGAGRFAVLEFNVLRENSPTINTDPRAWKTMLGFTHYVANIKMLEQKSFQKYVAAGRDPGTFPAYWTDQLVKSGAIKYGDMTNDQASDLAKELKSGTGNP